VTEVHLREAFSFDVNDFKVVVKNDIYTVKDLYLEDDTGAIRATVTITILNPFQQTNGHIHYEADEIYFIDKGEGVMLIGDHLVHLHPQQWVIVPKTKRHKIINTTKEKMEFQTYLPLHLARSVAKVNMGKD